MAQVLGCVLPPELVKRAHGSDSAIFGSDTLGASHVVCISALLMFCHQDFKKKSIMVALGLHCRSPVFSSCGEQRQLFVAVPGFLIAVVSLIIERSPSSCGSWA